MMIIKTYTGDQLEKNLELYKPFCTGKKTFVINTSRDLMIYDLIFGFDNRQIVIDKYNPFNRYVRNNNIHSGNKLIQHIKYSYESVLELTLYFKKGHIMFKNFFFSNLSVNNFLFEYIPYEHALDLLGRGAGFIGFIEGKRNMI